MGKKIYSRNSELAIGVHRFTVHVRCRNGFSFWPDTGRAVLTPFFLLTAVTFECKRTVLSSVLTAQSMTASFQARLQIAKSGC